MSIDKETLAAYAEKADEYAQVVTGAPDARLTAFIGALPQGARVLDLGCGPGHASAEMAAAGLQVEATDASPEMIIMANQNEGVQARQASFDEISGTDLYDGIWASFSLLHASHDDFPRYLAALREALKPGGIFHIGMKLGEGSKRDRLGRLYSFYTADALHQHLKTAGFTPFSSHTGKEKGLAGTLDPWITITSHG